MNEGAEARTTQLLGGKFASTARRGSAAVSYVRERLHTFEDGWVCDGWRREFDDCEVAESYMDAKFGGEVADMAEVVAGGGW